jgi:hypothetical protein
VWQGPCRTAGLSFIEVYEEFWGLPVKKLIGTATQLGKNFTERRVRLKADTTSESEESA